MLGKKGKAAKQMKQPKLSICICTYNRADYLDEMLTSLAQNALTENDEVLVIDNNCTDHTQEVLARHADTLPLRQLHQPKQGLSNARNKGLECFTGDAIIFFDDDLLIDQDALSYFRQGLTQYPEHHFFGGRLDVLWPNATPPKWWVQDQFSLINGLVGSYNLGASDCVYAPQDRLPYGANFALRRALVDALGQFDVALGVSGTELGRGEETDYFERALKQGYRGVYLANPKVLHRVEKERFSVSFLLRYGMAKGHVGPPRPALMASMSALSQLVRGALQLVRGRRGNAYQCLIMVGVHIGQGFRSA